MLIKLAEYMSMRNMYDIPYKGVVVDNADPDKLGRVKCTIADLLEGDTADLPWIFPKSPTGLGGASNVSRFAVPEVDSELLITFPYRDIYFGVYDGYWQSATTHSAKFDDNYPYKYGFIDSYGNRVTVDTNSGEVIIEHGSGTKIKVANSGRIEGEGADTAIITIEGEVKIESVNGKIILQGKNGNTPSGIVTQQCTCPLVAGPHIDFSTDTEASK